MIYEEPSATVISGISDFLTGLHLQHFRHWLLRWFYVLGGLSGCACIATGFIFFVEKRKRQHAEQGIGGARWAEALAVTTVTGMLIATLTMLVANRALPVDFAHRSDWEKYVFWGAWVLAYAHAVWRTAPVRQAKIAPAWIEHCWTVAGLGVAAVGLNWITTGDHLLRTIGNGYWPVAGVDLSLLVTSSLAVIAALKLRQRARGLSTGENQTQRGTSKPAVAGTARA